MQKKVYAACKAKNIFYPFQKVFANAFIVVLGP